MGKIKSKQIRKAGQSLVKRGAPFTESFEHNKKILGSNTMPSKKLRNQMAGFVSRFKRKEATKLLEFANSLNKR